MPATEAALIAVAAMLAAGSVLAGVGLAVAALALARVSNATRVRDAEIEAGAAVHADATRRLQATEQAVRRTMAALGVAHAADVARVGSAMGEPPPHEAGAVPPSLPGERTRTTHSLRKRD